MNIKKYEEIHFVRYTPYEIKEDNYEELLIPEH